MITMYEGKVNSPATTLDGSINNVVTTINIIDGTVLPNAPNIAVIGTGEDSETILYATKVGNQLSNVTRGFQGVAKAWSTGEAISRLFTEYDYGALKGNVETIAVRKITDFAEVSSAELAGKITDEIGSGNLFFGTEGEWTPILSFGGASAGIIYSVQAGLYRIVGDKISVTGEIVLSSKGSSVGSVLIEGLPSACVNKPGSISPFGIYLRNISFLNYFAGYIPGNTSYVVLHNVSTGGGTTALSNNNFNNNSIIRVSGTYFID